MLQYTATQTCFLGLYFSEESESEETMPGWQWGNRKKKKKQKENWWENWNACNFPRGKEKKGKMFLSTWLLSWGSSPFYAKQTYIYRMQKLTVRSSWFSEIPSRHRKAGFPLLLHFHTSIREFLCRVGLLSLTWLRLYTASIFSVCWTFQEWIPSWKEGPDTCSVCFSRPSAYS